MKRLSIFLIAASSLAGVANAGPLTYGAASLVTIRGCTAGNTASTACYSGFGGGLANPNTGHIISGVNTFNYDGGQGQSVSNVDYVGIYGESKARSQYTGPLALPELGVATQASNATATAVNGNPLEGFRLGSHAINYQTYQYDGDAASPFSLEIDFHYITSGRTNDDSPYVAEPGAGLVTAEIILFDPAVLFAPLPYYDYADEYGDMATSDAERIFGHAPGGACQAGALGYASATSGLASGEATQTFHLSTALNTDGSCTDSGSPLTLLPGQQFGVMAILHSYSSRGGFADSFGTLTVALDPTLPAEVQQQLTQTLTAATEVPEPAMLGLFGLSAGAMLLSRRRKR